MPCRQLRQLWQATLGETTTRAPTSAPEAAAPASTTVPTISWPSTTPVVAGWPGGFSTMCRSVPQTPQASTSTSTSLGEPRTGRARRWTSTLSGPANTTARIVPAADRSLLMALPSFVRWFPRERSCCLSFEDRHDTAFHPERQAKARSRQGIVPRGLAHQHNWRISWCLLWMRRMDGGLPAEPAPGEPHAKWLRRQGAPGPYHDLTRRWRPPTELREGRRRRWPDGRPCRRPALRPGRRATHE